MPTTDGPQTWVIVGLDDRTQQVSGTDIGPQAGSETDGANADVIMVATQTSEGWKLTSIRRDVRYALAGNRPGRLGLAWRDAPQDFVDQMCVTLNIPADHIVAVNLRAFVTVVDDLGGIDITVPNAMRDPRANLDLPAGTQHVDGATALGYVRSRQGQVLIDGQWVDDPEGMSGRVRRSAEVFNTVMSELRAHPALAAKTSWSVAPDVQLDSGTHLWDLASLRNVSGAPVEQLPLTGGDDQPLSYVNDDTRAMINELGYESVCRL